ncbi:hypothetical protein [Peredibacter starrii]|uniref:Uncharacterized protein n=1 Tax=Peredibacter starrii TaxID=28202 RepID=A0AAX4HTJ8_9BACT|nr:hypothetical protein [Peredibacter starrii]WPU66515.1 hypothetical protein SOO65_07130 [Peredibacter starrii]
MNEDDKKTGWEKFDEWFLTRTIWPRYRRPYKDLHGVNLFILCPLGLFMFLMSELYFGGIRFQDVSLKTIYLLSIFTWIFIAWLLCWSIKKLYLHLKR